MDDARFAELAVMKGYLTSQQVRTAVTAQKKHPSGQAPSLARAAVGLGMLSSERAQEMLQSEGESLPAIGGYRLVEKLSSGKEGNVYGAVQLSMARKVLLKVLEGERAADENAVRRFKSV